MSKIKVMDEVLANKIAAGEVIEKLMNVVKELTENSLDAGATEIKIELVDTGLKLIKVTDNGVGMTPDDAVLAFSRHATSKCKSINDLFNIESLGFRGEALPSIASVSKVRLKTSDGVKGSVVTLEGGENIHEEASDLVKGTSIEVRDIFYNTPVRLKYIKNLYSELASITEYVDKMALSYPNVKFILTNNDKVLLNTDGNGNLLKVIYEIYGKNIASKMIEFKEENEDYKISGYISYPECYRATKNAINVFVNGRAIKNNEIIRVIVDAYHTYIHAGKYPVVILNIETDPVLVDCNVHPTKMDIKFSKMDTLKDLIYNTFSDTLKKIVFIPEASVRSDSSLEEVIKNDVEDKEEEKKENVIDLNNVEEINDDDTKYEESPVQLKLVEDTNESPYKIKKMIPRGIVYKTYIIAENEDGMYLIDQHAAAERVNYEKTMKKFLNHEGVAVPLLVPISLEYPKSDFIILKSKLDVLSELGFVVEEFGENTFVVREHSSLFVRDGHEKEDTAKIFDILLKEKNFDEKKFIDHTVATTACRMSIKANDYITLSEAEYVLDELRKCDQPFNCPHGRPTIITFTKYELEKMFKRVLD